MKVLSPARMAQYDEYAIKTWGIPSAVLMENAGRNTYRLMKERYLSEGKRLAIFCGRGNNGGDGFVIGRYAFRDGFDVTVYLLCAEDVLKGDAQLNMRLYRSVGGRIVEIGDDRVEPALDGMKHADVIVDAIFGTGLSKPVAGKEKAVIDGINLSGKTVVAVDIPSGVDGATGLPLGVAVNATHTYTYGYPKTGQILQPGAYHAGRLTVIDISIPSHAEEALGIDGELVDGEMLRGFLKKRMPWAHKGSFGHTAVIAGSVGKTGAAHMSTLAALKIGAGLVTLVVPSSLNAIMEMKLTEAMTYPVEDNGKGYFPLSCFEAIRDFVEDKDVIIMGPGLSQDQETAELVRRLYMTVDKPFIVDADGINAFAGYVDILQKAKREAVFTPHPGELGRLIDMSPGQINENRIAVGTKFMQETGVTLVLKGARTIVFSPREGVYIIPTGNSSLAKGGSGDILTGFIGGLVSQGYSLKEAATLGAYLHGYVADMWTDDGSDMDLLACDLLAGLGKALREIGSGEDRTYIEKSL